MGGIREKALWLYITMCIGLTMLGKPKFTQLSHQYHSLVFHT